MPRPKPGHVWRRLSGPKQQRSPDPRADGSTPTVNPATLTPKTERQRDAAAMDTVIASRPLLPPGRRA